MGAVIIAGRYVPRPPHETTWDANLKGIGTLRMPVGGGFPFKPKFFGSSYNDQGLWYGQSFDVPLTITLPPTVASNPFAPKRWSFNDLDTPSWAGPVSSAFDTLTQTLQLYAPAPARNYPYLPETAEWNGSKQRVNNLLLNAVVQAPLVPSRWTFNYDDAGLWNGKPSNVNRVIDLAFVPPLAPSRWKLDYDDRAVWYTKPGNIPASKMPVGGGFPFQPDYWRYNFDDAGVWQKKSFGPSLVLELASNLPFVPRYWRFNTDEPPSWNGKPINVGIVQRLVIASPLLPQRWKYDFNDASVWSGHPLNVPVTITQPIAPTTIGLVSTLVLNLPVNCVLIGDQLYERTGKTFERVKGKSGRKTIASGSGVKQLSDSPSSFTVTTNKKGYD